MRMQSAAAEQRPVASGAVASGASSMVRLASLVALAGTAFLYSYMIFHALHVAGRDPSCVSGLGGIPLFCTCEAALLGGLCLGLAFALTVRDFERLLSRLPSILLTAIALFTLEILLFP